MGDARDSFAARSCHRSVPSNGKLLSGASEDETRIRRATVFNEDERFVAGEANLFSGEILGEVLPAKGKFERRGGIPG